MTFKATVIRIQQAPFHGSPALSETTYLLQLIIAIQYVTVALGQNPHSSTSFLYRTIGVCKINADLGITGKSTHLFVLSNSGEICGILASLLEINVHSSEWKTCIHALGDCCLCGHSSGMVQDYDLVFIGSNLKTPSLGCK